MELTNTSPNSNLVWKNRTNEVIENSNSGHILDKHKGGWTTTIEIYIESWTTKKTIYLCNSVPQRVVL